MTANLTSWSGIGLADVQISSGNVTAQAGTGDTAPAAIVGNNIAVAGGRLKFDQQAGVAAYLRWAHASVAGMNGIGTFTAPILPGSTAVIWQAVGSGSIRYRFAITASGQLQAQKSGGTVLATSTGTLTPGNQYYLLHYAILSTTVGEVHALVTDASGAVIAQVDSTAQNLGGNVDALWLGPTTTTPTLGTLYWGGILTTDQAAMPPTPGATTGGGGANPTPGAGRRIAVVGDSLTYMGNTGDGIIRAALVALGWTSENIFIDGVIGRTLNTADSTGRTASQVISTYRATSGEPDQWIIALGTNNLNNSSSWAGDIGAVMTTLGASAKVTWINVGIRNTIDGYSVVSGTGTDTRVNGFNAALTTALSGYSRAAIANWRAFVHNGRDETNPNLWNTGDSTGYHMAPQGWNLRGGFYASSVGAPAPDVVIPPTVTTTFQGSTAYRILTSVVTITGSTEFEIVTPPALTHTVFGSTPFTVTPPQGTTTTTVSGTVAYEIHDRPRMYQRFNGQTVEVRLGIVDNDTVTWLTPAPA